MTGRVTGSGNKWPVVLSFLLPLLLTLVFYWLTRYPSINWWGQSEYSIAACTLGVTSPPGSLLLPLLGWLFIHLPTGLSDLPALNSLTGIFGAVAVGLVSLFALSMLRRPEELRLSTSARQRRAFWFGVIGSALGAATFGLGETVWYYSTLFSVYILTMMFTGLILLGMWRWWVNADSERASRWLFVIALLVGLDFSVHRTNAVLIPAILLWVLILHPATFAKFRNWLCALGGLVLGLAFNLLIIPISMRDPIYNFSNPSNLSRYWDYISLKQMGGGFMLNFFPRKAPLWSVQVKDYLDAFTSVFFAGDGPLGVIGFLPVVIGLVGIVILWRKQRRLALALTVAFVVTTAVTIFYFNIPANYFRSLHRHYLPCFLIFGLFVAYGAAAMMYWCASRERNKVWPTGLLALLLISLPVTQVARNYRNLDGTAQFFAYDFARNTLSGLPENAILVTGGDNDTFPLWFLQRVEGFRTDVTVLNMPLTNTYWFLRETIHRNPDFPLRWTDDELASLRPRLWQDTTITLPVTGDVAALGLDEGTAVPDSVSFEVTSSYAGNFLVQDWVLLNLIIENNWRRPVCFASSMSPQSTAWLQSHLRLEGYHTRLMPLQNAPLNPKILKHNLFDLYTYRGYNDPDIPLDATSRYMATSLLSVALGLASAELQSGDKAACESTLDRILAALPPERIQPPESFTAAIERFRELIDKQEETR